MKARALSLLLIALATSANAGVVWDESVNGGLSTNPAAPTSITFIAGSNTINGTVGNVGGIQRDYITFTLVAGQKLTGLNLLGYNSSNLGFAAFNAGSTSHVPSESTNGFFMSGIHVTNADIGFDLMEFFVTRAVTSDALSVSEIDPGTYCFVIQQTSPTIVTYSLEFIVSGAVSADMETWGKIKALYK